MNMVVSPDADSGQSSGEDPSYLRDQLITCIGNKRGLIDEIGVVLDQVRKTIRREKLSFADLFAGSGVVSRRAKQIADHIIANDLEPYSEITNRCYLSNAAPPLVKRLEQDLRSLRTAVEEDTKPGFITELYAPKDDQHIRPDERVFYTRRNALYINRARRAIATLPEDRQAYFLAPLLSAASVHANTAGVFKGFYKNAEGRGQFGGEGKYALQRILGEIDLRLPVLSRFRCGATVTRQNANELVHEMDAVDLAYIDPPYNQHPYGSNYFMLNLIASYERPAKISRVSGIPTDWNRSAYNKPAMAEDALFNLIEDCPASFVLVSYNSEGFVSKERFLSCLRKLGRLETRAVPYNTFRGSRNLHKRSRYVTEYLFLLDKR